MTPDIRRATLADAAALTACVRVAYASYMAQGLTLPPVDVGIDDDIRNNHVWVAVADGRICGGIVLVLGDKAHLANLAVHPDAGGQGIGALLIATVQDAARNAGYAALHLATHVEMIRTQTFYQRQGWTETGRDGNKVYFSYDLNEA